MAAQNFSVPPTRGSAPRLREARCRYCPLQAARRYCVLTVSQRHDKPAGMVPSRSRWSRGFRRSAQALTAAQASAAETGGERCQTSLARLHLRRGGMPPRCPLSVRPGQSGSTGFSASERPAECERDREATGWQAPQVTTLERAAQGIFCPGPLSRHHELREPAPIETFVYDFVRT